MITTQTTSPASLLLQHVHQYILLSTYNTPDKHQYEFLYKMYSELSLVLVVRIVVIGQISFGSAMTATEITTVSLSNVMLSFNVQPCIVLVSGDIAAKTAVILAI